MTKVVSVAVAPAEVARELRHWQELDGVDAEIGQVLDQLHGVAERAGLRPREAERADVQLIDDEVLDAGGHGQPRRELAQPEVFVAHNGWRRGDRLELRPDHVLVDDDAAADPAVKRPGLAVPGLLLGVDVTPADLPSGMDVGVVDGGTLRRPDAEHVRRPHILREVGLHIALPDPTGPRCKRDDRHGRVDALSLVVAHVPVVASREDDIDHLGVRRPHREPQPRGLRVPGVELLRTEVTALGEAIALLELPTRGRQSEVAVAFLRRRVADLKVDTPRCGGLRPFEADPPAHHPPRLGVGEGHRRGERRASVLACCCLHRYWGPAVPAAFEEGVTEQQPLDPAQVHEPYGYHARLLSPWVLGFGAAQRSRRAGCWGAADHHQGTGLPDPLRGMSHSPVEPFLRAREGHVNVRGRGKDFRIGNRAEAHLRI